MVNPPPPFGPGLTVKRSTRLPLIVCGAALMGPPEKKFEGLVPTCLIMGTTSRAWAAGTAAQRPAVIAETSKEVLIAWNLTVAVSFEFEMSGGPAGEAG